MKWKRVVLQFFFAIFVIVIVAACSRPLLNDTKSFKAEFGMYVTLSIKKCELVRCFLLFSRSVIKKMVLAASPMKQLIVA